MQALRFGKVASHFGFNLGGREFAGVTAGEGALARLGDTIFPKLPSGQEDRATKEDSPDNRAAQVDVGPSGAEGLQGLVLGHDLAGEPK